MASRSYDNGNQSVRRQVQSAPDNFMPARTQRTHLSTPSSGLSSYDAFRTPIASQNASASTTGSTTNRNNHNATRPAAAQRSTQSTQREQRQPQALHQATQAVRYQEHSVPQPQVSANGTAQRASRSQNAKPYANSQQRTASQQTDRAYRQASDRTQRQSVTAARSAQGYAASGMQKQNAYAENSTDYDIDMDIDPFASQSADSSSGFSGNGFASSSDITNGGFASGGLVGTGSSFLDQFDNLPEPQESQRNIQQERMQQPRIQSAGLSQSMASSQNMQRRHESAFASMERQREHEQSDEPIVRHSGNAGIYQAPARRRTRVSSTDATLSIQQDRQATDDFDDDDIDDGSFLYWYEHHQWISFIIAICFILIGMMTNKYISVLAAGVLLVIGYMVEQRRIEATGMPTYVAAFIAFLIPFLY